MSHGFEKRIGDIPGLHRYDGAASCLRTRLCGVQSVVVHAIASQQSLPQAEQSWTRWTKSGINPPVGRPRLQLPRVDARILPLCEPGALQERANQAARHQAPAIDQNEK